MSTTFDVVLTNPPFNREETRQALDRGELIRLLADVEAGRITPQQLNSVLTDRDASRWFVRWVQAIFGR